MQVIQYLSSPLLLVLDNYGHASTNVSIDYETNDVPGQGDGGVIWLNHSVQISGPRLRAGVEPFVDIVPGHKEYRLAIVQPGELLVGVGSDDGERPQRPP